MKHYDKTGVNSKIVITKNKYFVNYLRKKSFK